MLQTFQRLEYKFGKYGVVFKSGSNEIDCLYPSDMRLVGSNSVQTDEMCNVFGRNRGCLNHAGHVGKDLPKGVFGQLGVDGKIGANQGVIFPAAQHCSDPLCPVCCFSWARKTVKRVMNRFDVFDGYFGEDFEKRHVAISIPEFDWDKPLKFLRKQAIAFCEMVGVEGGVMIFHPKRLRESTKHWYFSPHFHVIGYVKEGWVDGKAVAVVNSLTGYVLKNLGKRKSIVGTLFYQLSHAGCGGRHVQTSIWFGECNNRKTVEYGFKEIMDLNRRDAKFKEKLCPVCGESLKRVCRVADKVVFEYGKYEEVFVLDSVDNWQVLPDFPKKFRKSDYTVDEEDLYNSYKVNEDAG